MVRTAATLGKSIDALAALEPAFAKVLKQFGKPEPRKSERGAITLLRTIVGQQVSVAAARSMWAKLEAAYGSPPDLKRILKASDEELRAAGISRQKAGYARSLAELVLSGELDLAHLPKDDEEAIALLTKIKGIGRWSAEIYLLFAEGPRATSGRPATSPSRSRSASCSDSRNARPRSSCANSAKPGAPTAAPPPSSPGTATMRSGPLCSGLARKSADVHKVGARSGGSFVAVIDDNRPAVRLDQRGRTPANG